MTDHVRGTGRVELVEFGDFECPYCRDAVTSVRRALVRSEGLARLRWRHFPVVAKHANAQRAAEAAEAAAEQGRFWEMHDALFERGADDVVARAREIGLDVARFESGLDSGRFAAAVAADREDGVALGVTGTPAFFVGGVRHRGFYDVESLVDAIEDAAES